MEIDIPVILLWAVPVVIAVGGGIYLIDHMH
jgi:hypothetical protein